VIQRGGFPSQQQITRRRQGWRDLVPIDWIGERISHPYAGRQFRAFLPLDRVSSVQAANLAADIEEISEGRDPVVACDLGDDWQFDRLQADANKREGHMFRGRVIESLPHQLIMMAYDLETSVLKIHPDLPSQAAAAFWTSWRVWQHLASWCPKILGELLQQDSKAVRLQGTGESTAVRFVCRQLWAYAQEVKDWRAVSHSTDVSAGAERPPAPIAVEPGREERSLDPSSTSAEAYKDRWVLLLGTDEYHVGEDARGTEAARKYGSVVRNLAVKVGFRAPLREVDAWLDIVRKTCAIDYLRFEFLILKLPEASADACSKLNGRAREKGNDELATILEECENLFSELDCWDLSALRLADSSEENPELARYLEAPSAADGNRSGPATGDPARETAAADPSSANETTHVALLQTILDKRPTTLEKWARGHKLGRTTVFDWKAARVSGKSLKGKVSDSKLTAIEKAIEDDAKALGLSPGRTRTSSDSSE
jgi:hypothetical protein